MIDFVGKEVKAVSKYVKTSPNKLRRVLKQLKGKTYLEALLLLKFLPYRACTPVIKTLRSAFANTKDSYSGNEQK
jgi:large subunit ribosomal protein L22